MAAAVPFLIGLAACVLTAFVAWSLVRDDFSRWAVVGASRHGTFVPFFATFAGFAAFLISRRVLAGPALIRLDWLLAVPRVAPTATDYRTAKAPAIEDLVRALEQVGYRPELLQVDEFGTAVGPVKNNSFLVGAMFKLTDPRLGEHGSVIVRISEQAADADGMGFVEALDTSKGLYEELATFVIVGLGSILPGLKYKNGDSILEPDDVGLLRATLPPRPLSLTRSDCLSS